MADGDTDTHTFTCTVTDPQQQQQLPKQQTSKRKRNERRKLVSDWAIEKKKEYDKQYNKKRRKSSINIVSEIDRWNRFKLETSTLNDEEMAQILLDHYERTPSMLNGTPVYATQFTSLNNVIEISKKLIESQTKSANEISSHCSEISGYEFHCNKILESCNQIVSETLNTSYTVINLCQLVIAEAGVSPSSLKNINNISEIAKRQVGAPTNKLSTMIDTASLMNLYIDNAERVSTSAGTVSENRVEGNDVDVDLSKVKVEKDAVSCSVDMATGHYKEASEMENQNEIEERQISSEVEDHTENKTEDHDNRDEESESSVELSDNDALEYDDNINNDPDWDVVKQLEENKVCTDPFKKEKSYKRRKRSHQNDFLCEVCDKHFDLKKELRKHIFSQTDENHLKLHKMMSPVKKKRQCELCGQVFSYAHNFKTHMLRHSGEKNFACDQCDYKGYTNKHLAKHMICHKAVREYICYHCGKQFLRNAGLTRHLIYHTGVKSYQCNLCPKKFVQSSHLARHKKTHKEDLPYACEICGKRSRQAYNITVHMRTHNGHKPFSCEICGNKFAHNVSLRQHKKSCHGEIINKAGGDDSNTLKI
ncbi:zinc finger protein 665 [Patella vulgata]|uniref:zinc finger protein 665 n=1 Tax=Patella vulgata TaxID=6465 RepID=UPI00217FBACB|nr:zinc finger protein 665 [Patella vulgata]